MVREVTSVSNTISRDVDLWVDIILQGYIIEFEVKAIASYSEAERKIFQGPQRRYLLSVVGLSPLLQSRNGFLPSIGRKGRVPVRMEEQKEINRK